MGNNCESIKDPNTANPCWINISATYEVPDFCTFAGPAGKSHRESVCSSLSTGGEWEYSSEGGSCNYNDCHAYQSTSPGCCKGCCGIVGEGAVCERVKYTGDPVQCCINDMFCANVDELQNPPQCYSDLNNGQHTCDHLHRSMSSTGCQDVMTDYCLGSDGSPDWLERWTPDGEIQGPCAKAVYRNLTKSCDYVVEVTGACLPNLETPIDAEGFFWSQNLVAQAFQKFTSEGGVLGAFPGFPGYNPWQGFMHDQICCPFPSLCQGSLQQICENKNTEDLSKNPGEAQWCGCHLPLSEYEQYSVLYNIQPQCTPICNRLGVIPKVGNSGVPITCNQNICLIDNVTLNLINAQVRGGINFEQVCSGCQGAQCSCIVSDTTIDISNSTIGGNFVPIAEGCGSSTCYQTNNTSLGPERIPILCPAGVSQGNNPFATYQATQVAGQQKASKTGWMITVFVAAGLLLLMFSLILLFSR